MNDTPVPGAAPDTNAAASGRGSGSPERFVAEELSADAVRRRRRERWRAALVTEELSVTAALLGAGPAPAVLVLGDGVELAGSVVSVGVDVVAVRAATTDWWIALRTVEAVRADRIGPGDPLDRGSSRLDEVLADLLDAAPVTIVTFGGATIDGELRAVGAGVVLDEASGRRVVVDPARIARVGRRVGRRA